MRQLINSTYITLDGVVEGPHLWPSLKGGTSDEGDTIQTDLLETCDIVLMGRRTYEVFAPAWSSRGGDPYSDRINALRKVVVSTTLTDPEWNNSEVFAGDVVGRVRDLKDEDGGHSSSTASVTSRDSCSKRPLRPTPAVDLSAARRPERRQRPALPARHRRDVRPRGHEGPEQRHRPGDLRTLSVSGRDSSRCREDPGRWTERSCRWCGPREPLLVGEERDGPSGVVAFVLTDIEGSTKLARDLGDGTPA